MNSIRLLLIATLIVYCGTSVDAQTIRHVRISGLERTRQLTIERELLFAAGQPYDADRLVESERNLRRLPFLGEVSIRAFPSGQHVDIEVRIQELYSRALSPIISGSMRAINYGLVGLDYNLMGRGQRARLAVQEHSDTGKSVETSFLDPRFQGTAHSAWIYALLGSDTRSFKLSLSRPFYTLNSRLTYGVNLHAGRQLTRLYAGGQLDSAYPTRQRTLHFWYGLSRGTTVKLRPRIAFKYTDQTTPHATDSGPRLLRRHQLESLLTLTLWQPQFSTDRFIADLGPVEDIQTGSWLSLSFGYAHARDKNYSSSILWSAHLAPRRRIGQSTYVFSSFVAEGQGFGSTMQNVRMRSALNGYMRIGTHHSVALRFAMDALLRTQQIDQLLLGMDTGLRGLPAHALAGNRRTILNLELRPTLHYDQRWTLAAASFFDAGNAWNKSERSRLCYAYGMGLRLGFPQLYNTPVWRLDLAWSDRGHWHLSLGLGQYF